MERGEKKKKKNAWERGGEVTGGGGRIKRGLGIAFKFRGPTGLQGEIPSGAGTRARLRSGLEPKLLQPRDGGPSESPVSSALSSAPAGLKANQPALAPLTLCPDSSH